MVNHMRTKILFLIILSTYILPQSVFAQYQTPKDPRYWRFYNWYISHSIVTLVVNGKEENHLRGSLAQLSKLKEKGVLIGDIMIIGGGKNLAKITTEAGLSNEVLENAEFVVNKYEIKNSPTWIVRYQGKDYVYEGLSSPQNLFTSQGMFREAP